MKQQKNKFEYDDCGNMTYEYMRGNGTGEATTEVVYTYDALHQVVKAHETYGKATRNYQYDSLGNLTYEWDSNNVKVDYKLNNLNQITSKTDDGWKTSTAYSYDNRGNETGQVYTKNKKVSTTAAYVFDETNKMVLGTNDIGEQSAYLYNGLGALVQNTWTIKKNAYGYHNVTNLTTLSNLDEAEILIDTATGKTQTKEKLDAEVVAADATLNKTSVVEKNFVVDYTSETFDPLYESEVNGLDYRYVYGNERLSVTVKGVQNGSGHIIENGNEIRLYYHMDLRGTIDYLTSPVSQKVESWTHYNEWGEITHNAVLKCGERELDMVKHYATHDFDQVLGLYYAKARMYDAGDRRFISMDPFSGIISDARSLVQYLYCLNNPVVRIDPLGLVSYDMLNLIGYGLYIGLPHEWAFTGIMFGNGNAWLAGHQLAQAFIYKWLMKSYGYTAIMLEQNLPDAKTRVDVVGQKGSTISLFEVKHRRFPHYEEYSKAQNVNKAADKQLGGYYDTLKCYISSTYTLERVSLAGEVKYKLFGLNATEWYINLRHQNGGLIDYWFSKENKENPPDEILPTLIVEEWTKNNILKKQQEAIHAYLKHLKPATVIAVTVGIVVAGVMTAVVIEVAGPAIAAWAASAAVNVKIAVASSGAVLYQAGQVITNALSKSPAIQNIFSYA